MLALEIKCFGIGARGNDFKSRLSILNARFPFFNVNFEGCDFYFTRSTFRRRRFLFTGARSETGNRESYVLH